MIRQISGITMAWTLVGALDALNTHFILNGDLIGPLGNYDFVRNFWVSTLSACFAGIFSGSFLIFFLRERFRRKSFGLAILVNSLIISTLNFAISAVAHDLFLGFDSGRGPLDREVLMETASLMRSAYYAKSIIFWTFIVFLTITTLHVNEKYGSGVLRKLLLGRYRHPREEERIFMFVDIKSSTTIAEQLGHINFFNLLNDYYRDITNSIIYTKGEIYQYVGDEVVISWNMKNGIHNGNCVRCFYGMQEAIQKRSQRYREKYGLAPEFKAGLHYGVVTTGEIGVIKKDIVYSGDVMNTTSRIQSLCNHYGVKILLSKYLLDRLQLPPHGFQALRVGMIELKGRRQKVELYTFDEPVTTEDMR